LYDEEEVERSGSGAKLPPLLLSEGDVGDLAIRDGMVSFCARPFEVRDVDVLSPNVERRRDAGVADTAVSRGLVTGRRDVERVDMTPAADGLVVTEEVATDALLALVRVEVDNRGVRV
jgi:hypothetical protein